MATAVAVPRIRHLDEPGRAWVVKLEADDEFEITVERMAELEPDQLFVTAYVPSDLLSESGGDWMDFGRGAVSLESIERLAQGLLAVVEEAKRTHPESWRTV